MAVVVLWSDEAKETFADNIQYLKDAWTEKEIKKFILRSEYVLLNIEQNPTLYASSKKSRNTRKASINRHISLYYRYYPTKKIVILMSFWNNYMDDKKLKY